MAIEGGGKAKCNLHLLPPPFPNLKMSGNLGTIYDRFSSEVVDDSLCFTDVFFIAVPTTVPIVCYNFV